MTIDQLEAVSESLEIIQDRADMEHAATVLAPRLLAEVWSLRGLLIRAEKYLDHISSCDMLDADYSEPCSCGLKDLFNTLEKVQR